MPYEDSKRAADFYTKAFGWKAQVMGPEMGNDVVMQTTDTDKDGMNKEPGRINGGLFKESKDNPAPSVVVSVVDIKAAMKKVQAAGGTLIDMEKPGEPMDIPGVGLYMGFTDTEGNRVSLLQPNATMSVRPGKQ